MPRDPHRLPSWLFGSRLIAVFIVVNTRRSTAVRKIGTSFERLGGKPLVHNAITRSLRIDDKANVPCCHVFFFSSGTVVACLRKLQRWNLTSILEEYRRFTKHKVIFHVCTVVRNFRDLLPCVSLFHVFELGPSPILPPLKTDRRTPDNKTV